MKRRIGFLYHFNDRDWMGGKNYFSSLFSAVQLVAPEEVELVLFKGHQTQTTLAQEHPYVQVVNTPMLDRRSPQWLLRQARRQLSSKRWDPAFDALLRRQRIDLLSNAEPLLAQGSTIKSLGWLPDFQFHHLPAQWSAKELAGVKDLYAKVCRVCDAVLVSSHAAQADLRAFAPWCNKPVHVLHFVSSPVQAAGLPTAADLRQRYNLPGRYFHLPNQFWAHKNHRLVIDALALLQADAPDITVVCTGNTHDPRQPEHVAQLLAQRDALHLQSAFRVLGMVPYADMQGLMRQACAVINPSRFEGWSTSVEEAKSMGQHVLLSDLPVHREQAPASASYFAVDDARALADALLAAHCRPTIDAHERPMPAPYEERLRAFGQAYLHIVRGL
jgi:glycosyltransferase involved in cell wall biosynthesis